MMKKPTTMKQANRKLASMFPKSAPMMAAPKRMPISAPKRMPMAPRRRVPNLSRRRAY